MQRMSTLTWGISRKGELTLFNRDPPSCFSNRVARVRRSNTLEDRRLQDKLRTIHLEHSIRNGQIHNEKKTLVRQLNGIHSVKETPEIGVERRKLQQAKASVKKGNALHGINTTPPYSQALLQPQGKSSSSVTHHVTTGSVTQYPSADCRSSYTGCRLRKSPTISRSADWLLPRSPTYPLFTMGNEWREALGISSSSEVYNLDTSSTINANERQNMFPPIDSRYRKSSF